MASESRLSLSVAAAAIRACASLAIRGRGSCANGGELEGALKGIKRLEKMLGVENRAC